MRNTPYIHVSIVTRGRSLCAIIFALALLSAVLVAPSAPSSPDQAAELTHGHNRLSSVESSYEATLKTNEHESFRVTLDEGYTIQYTLRVLSGSEVDFYILDEEQYEAFSDGQAFTSLHEGNASVGDPLTGEHVTTFSGEHHLVVWNPSDGYSDIAITANVDLFEELWELITEVCTVCILIIVAAFIIMVAALLALRKRKRPPVRAESSTSYSLDDHQPQRRRDSEDDLSRHEPEGYDDLPYKRDRFLRRRR